MKKEIREKLDNIVDILLDQIQDLISEEISGNDLFSYGEQGDQHAKYVQQQIKKRF